MFFISCLTMATSCKCDKDGLHSSFSTGTLVVIIHRPGHLIVNELLLMNMTLLKLCCFVFPLMFRTVECKLMLYIGVIMEDGFIFGYLILYLIFSLSFVKCQNILYGSSCLENTVCFQVASWWGLMTGGGVDIYFSNILCSITVFAHKLALDEAQPLHN